MRVQPSLKSVLVASVLAPLILAAAFPCRVSAAESKGLDTTDQCRAGARQPLLYIATEYKKIVSKNPLLAGLDPVLDRVSADVTAMSDDESTLVEERFGPLIQRMLSDLNVLKSALKSAAPAPVAGVRANDFPLAEYPAVDLGDIVLTVAETDLPDLGELLALINPLDPGTPGIPQIPNSIIPGKCIGDPDGDGVPTRTPESVLLYSRIGLQGLELTNAIAKDVCGQDLGAFGFSGNLSVVCILFDVGFLVPRFLYDNVLQCEGFIDGAEATASYLRLDYLHGEMGEVKADLGRLATSITGGFDVVNGKLNTLTDKADQILSDLERQWNFLSTFKQLSIRMAIEHALTANGVDKVSLFQLPAAYGGHLELVRQIVLETIQNTRAAGQSVYNAQKEFDKGNDAFLKRAFKTAYEQYRKAYVEAVK